MDEPSSSQKSPVLDFVSMQDDQVQHALQKYSIGLTVEEARKVQELLGRAPTVTEAVIWGIQGSEHCSYKSSRRFLGLFPTKGKNVILGPGEDSGIIAVTDAPHGKRWGIVISHESHNHPSQIVPFEGAATGVGGTVRDVLCMGARVIGCMDMLRLGSTNNENARNISKEVIRGIAGYANPLGLPNIGGDTVFDDAFNDNCLVNAIAVGIVREDEIIHSFVPDEAAQEKYDIILVGKPTDRSGFGGAAFASISMEEEKKEQNTGAVQEPNPFLERHLLLSTYALFDWLIANKKLPKVSFKDLGAGGVVCSSVEQVAAKNFGADIDLEKVHTSIDNLPPEVIACAETQERFCWMCHPSLTQHILNHYNKVWDLPSIAEGAKASVIGKVTNTGVYTLLHKGKIVCNAKSVDITSGLKYTRPTVVQKQECTEPDIKCSLNTITYGKYRTTIADVFIAMIQHPNYASRWPVIHGYDKTVIGNSIIEAGEADASVITPFKDLQSYLPGGAHPDWNSDASLEKIGIAFAADGNPRYGKVSAYLQGMNAAVEAMCNVAAVGALPRALTDCLNYGNPEIPNQLGALEEGVKGIADAAHGLQFDHEPVPVISGNVSLYNGKPDGSAIPPSAIVCAIGVLQDASHALPMHLQKAKSHLYLIGERKNECGASAYYEVLAEMFNTNPAEMLGANVPSPLLSDIHKRIRLLHQAASHKLILSSHDISDGGLLLALFEMTTQNRKMGGNIGMNIQIQALKNDRADVALFSQSQGFIVEIDAESEPAFKKLALELDVPLVPIGETTKDPTFSISDGQTKLLHEELSPLHTLWSNGLKKALRGL
jgi:phosphoribosylformylglycinamidine synthase